MTHHDRDWNQDDESNDEADPVDTLAVLKADMDQMLMLAPELARVTKGWFDSFKAEGFSDNQALYLTAVQLKDTPGPPPS